MHGRGYQAILQTGESPDPVWGGGETYPTKTFFRLKTLNLASCHFTLPRVDESIFTITKIRDKTLLRIHRNRQLYFISHNVSQILTGSAFRQSVGNICGLAHFTTSRVHHEPDHVRNELSYQRGKNIFSLIFFFPFLAKPRSKDIDRTQR